MADAPSRASTRTTLKWGTIEAPIGLFKTTQDPAKLAAFEQGGPNGGRLERGVIPEGSTKPVKLSDPLSTGPASAPRGRSTPEAKSAPAPVTMGEAVLVEASTGNVVKAEDVRKGVWRTLETDDEGNVVEEEFIDCTLALGWIERETELDRMEIQGAIDVGRVPRERIIDSYYVGVDAPETVKVLMLLCGAMKTTRKALVVKWTKTRRQATGVLVPYLRHAGGAPAIMLLQLAWAEDWRDLPDRARLQVDEAEHPEQVPTEAEYEQAAELLRAMADSSLLLEEQRDDALSLREELHKLALAGDVGDFIMPTPEPVPDLLGALERSLELARA